MRLMDAIEEVPGLTYRQLDYWIRTGRVRMADPTPGSGIPREDLADGEVAFLRILVPLVRDGVALSKAHDLARDLLSGSPAHVGGLPITLPERTAS